MKTHNRTTSRHKQRGIVAIIMTIAMLAILSVTALAVDGSHMYMNRTKLQNRVDAAALAGAVVLDDGGSESAAIDAVNATLDYLVDPTSGNSELDLDSALIDVSFSSTSAFTTIGDCTIGEDCYVRVVVNNMDLKSFFMQMFTDTKQIAASAVAGPSAAATTACNIAPLTVCAVKSEDEEDYDENGGYDDGDVIEIKVTSTDPAIGSGNFHLLDLDDEGLTDDDKKVHLREQLAGSYKECATIGEPVTTKPGNTVGPVSQGLNTRFGEYKGGIKEDDGYESDLNTTEGINYDVYESGEHNGRRMLLIPIIDCTESGNGKTEFPVAAFGCFFMLNKASISNAGGNGNGSDNGNSEVDKNVYGEFVTTGCESGNSYNNGESSKYGPYRIVLYKDPFNEDS